MDILDLVKARLQSFGYDVKPEDDCALTFAIGDTEQALLDFCNINEIPEGLKYVCMDRAVGEFLFAKRATGEDDLLSGINLDMMASQIKEGDITVSFGTGSDISPSARLDALIKAFRVKGKDQLIRYRRIAW